MKWVLFTLIIASVILAGCATNPEQPEPVSSQNFEFTYSFGVGSDNVLDTETNSYTKDMICEDDIQYTIELNEQEKQLISQKMNENNLLSIKQDFTQNCDAIGNCQDVTPLSGKDLTIKTANQTKTIKYRANYHNPNDPELQKFLEVTDLIEQIIRQKEQEQGIPQPTCGYL